jgi:hypothetical protein
MRPAVPLRSMHTASELAAFPCQDHRPTRRVRHFSNGWAAERNVDWSKAVVSLVRLCVDADEMGPQP